MKLRQNRLDEFLVRALQNLLVVRTADKTTQQHLPHRCSARPLGGGVSRCHERTALHEGAENSEGVQIEANLTLLEGNRYRRRGGGRYVGKCVCDGLVKRPHERLGSP